MSAGHLLADVRAALRVLWVAGLRRPDPTLPDTLADLAHDARAIGWGALAEPLDALSQAVARAIGGQGDHSAELFGLQRRVWVRAHLLQRRLSLHEVAVSLEQEASGTAPSAPPRPRGRSGTLWPIGIQRAEGSGPSPGLWAWHCLDDAGRWVTLEDRPLHVDVDDPFAGRLTSRLFHDDVRARSVLAGEVHLRDHPGTSTRARWVGRPAFHTRPQIRTAQRPGPPLPPLPTGARLGVGRRTVRFTHSPAGWAGTSGGMPVAVGERLAFDLDKRTLGGDTELSLDAAVVVTGDTLVVLAIDEPPRFPTLDPAATCWPLSRWQGSPASPEERHHQRQLAALAWPLVGGDRGRLAADLRAHRPATLADDWALRWAGRSLGLPLPDAVPRAMAILASPPAEPLPLLQALWLATRAGQPLGGLAEPLLAARSGPVDPDDTLEIVARGWLQVLGELDTAPAFLAAHGARWAADDVLPSVTGLTWVFELWRMARESQVDVPPLGFSRWALAKAALAPLRAARGQCTEEALDAWRLVMASEVEGWFLAR